LLFVRRKFLFWRFGQRVSIILLCAKVIKVLERNFVDHRQAGSPVNRMFSMWYHVSSVKTSRNGSWNYRRSTKL